VLSIPVLADDLETLTMRPVRFQRSKHGFAERAVPTGPLRLIQAVFPHAWGVWLNAMTDVHAASIVMEDVSHAPVSRA